MTQKWTEVRIVISDLADGTPDEHALREPRHPLQTTTVRAVAPQQPDGDAAETASVSAVTVQAEGKDKDDEQDAARTSGEPLAAPVLKTTETQKMPKVLIVEDTQELAEVLQATLERMNLETVHETHGNKALARLTDMKPDVVLLDISLPDITGWKILDTIKEMDEKSGQRPAVIVITAYGDPANRLVGKLQGVYSYLVKPFTSDEVEQVVTQALSAAR